MLPLASVHHHHAPSCSSAGTVFAHDSHHIILHLSHQTSKCVLVVPQYESSSIASQKIQQPVGFVVSRLLTSSLPKRRSPSKAPTILHPSSFHHEVNLCDVRSRMDFIEHDDSFRCLSAAKGKSENRVKAISSPSSSCAAPSTTSTSLSS